MERFLSILLVASTAARKVVVLDNDEWDSVVVTTSPVKITNSRFNAKNATRPNARMLNECEEGDLKCIYDNQLHENGPKNPAETIDKFLEKYSGVTKVKINQDLRNASSKAYWNQIEAEKHDHPFDDHKGWVTLDPIPWSASKVSKWKPQQAGDRPWMYGPPQQATSAPLWVTSGSNKRPSAQFGLASNDIITDNRPTNGFPLDSGFQNSYTRPQGSMASNSYRPPQNPQYNPQQHHYPQNPSYNNHPQFPQNEYYHIEHSTKQPPYQWPSPSNFPTPSPSYAGNSPVNNNYQFSTNRPINYPESGNGEWVLLSTTKGYSVPQRHYDRRFDVLQMVESPPERPNIVSRSFKSKYLENDIGNSIVSSADSPGNRKSDIGDTVWNVDGVNIIRTGRFQAKPETEAKQIQGVDEKQPTEMTYKRTVRLTVLPALNNTSTFSHDGMLEVDASPQSVEEAQQEEERLKKLQQISVVRSAQPSYQIIPIRSREINTSSSRKKAAVLAAVGAGMIPAAMAVLLPATLGRRRRREIAQNSPKISNSLVR